jgi:hypothetical protein
MFPSVFHTNILHAFLSSPPHPNRAMWTAHRILLDLIIQIILGEEYKFWSSSLCSFLHPPVTWFLFGPYVPLSTLFSNKLSLCPSLNVRDQVSHPYRTTGKIIVFYIQICMFSNVNGISYTLDVMVKAPWLNLLQAMDRARHKCDSVLCNYAWAFHPYHMWRLQLCHRGWSRIGASLEEEWQ